MKNFYSEPVANLGRVSVSEGGANTWIGGVVSSLGEVPVTCHGPLCRHKAENHTL